MSEYGYGIVDANKHPQAVYRFNRDEVESIAQKYHEEWRNLKNILGEHSEEESSNMVGWFDLRHKVQARYAYEIENLPNICNEVGLKVVKSR